MNFQIGSEVPVLEGFATLQRFIHKTNRWRLKLESGKVVYYEERQLLFFASCENDAHSSPKTPVSILSSVLMPTVSTPGNIFSNPQKATQKAENDSAISSASLLALIILSVTLALGLAKVLRWKTVGTLLLLLLLSPQMRMFAQKPFFSQLFSK